MDLTASFKVKKLEQFYSIIMNKLNDNMLFIDTNEYYNILTVYNKNIQYEMISTSRTTLKHKGSSTALKYTEL